MNHLQPVHHTRAPLPANLLLFSTEVRKNCFASGNFETALRHKNYQKGRN
jgi:hypothetical protein